MSVVGGPPGPRICENRATHVFEHAATSRTLWNRGAFLQKWRKSKLLLDFFSHLLGFCSQTSLSLQSNHRTTRLSFWDKHVRFVHFSQIWGPGAPPTTAIFQSMLCMCTLLPTSAAHVVDPRRNESSSLAQGHVRTYVFLKFV